MHVGNNYENRAKHMSKVWFISLVMVMVFSTITKSYSKTSSDISDGSAMTYLQKGNDYYKNGKLGLAVYTYEKGLMKNPFNAEIRHNRDSLLRKHGLVARANEIEKLKVLDYIVRITLPLIFILSLIYFLITNGVIRIFLLSTKKIIVLLVLVFIVFIGSSLLLQGFVNSQQAITISKNAVCKLGPNTDAKTIFHLKEGEKVEVFKTYLNWTKIKNNDGAVAWVSPNDIKQLVDR